MLTKIYDFYHRVATHSDKFETFENRVATFYAKQPA